MKIYFVRHGEAMDDVKKEYGGWANAELSEKGRAQVGERVKDLERRVIGAEIIFSSPFKRARESAEIIAQELKLEVREDVYLKERNTYGLLCGVGEEEASKKYPELVEAYKAGDVVLGYEPYDFFLKRVQALVKKLGELECQTLICVTHGKLLKALMEDIIGGEKVKKLHDACLVVVGLYENGSLKLLETDGVDFE